MATYKLLTGTHSRWIGDKKTGHREDYNAHDMDKNLMEDLTDEEIKSLGSRVVRIYQSGEVVEGKEGVEEGRGESARISSRDSAAASILPRLLGTPGKVFSALTVETVAMSKNPPFFYVYLANDLNSAPCVCCYKT